jgi:hypothetical protein
VPENQEERRKNPSNLYEPTYSVWDPTDSVTQPWL